jgi:hypothetical protein
VRRTRLWDRWSQRHAGACPFGVVLRAGSDAGMRHAPFPAWEYAPGYLPKGLVIEIAIDTPLTEPEFFYLGFQRERARQGQEPVVHAIPTTDLTGATISIPAPGPGSRAARSLEAAGLFPFDTSTEYGLRLAFDRMIGGRAADLRPELPLVLEL